MAEARIAQAGRGQGGRSQGGQGQGNVAGRLRRRGFLYGKILLKISTLLEYGFLGYITIPFITAIHKPIK